MNEVMGTRSCGTSLRFILRQLSKQLGDNFKCLGWKNQGCKGPGACHPREKVRVAGAANDQGYELGCGGRCGFVFRSACSTPLLHIEQKTWEADRFKLVAVRDTFVHLPATHGLHELTPRKHQCHTPHVQHEGHEMIDHFWLHVCCSLSRLLVSRRGLNKKAFFAFCPDRACAKQDDPSAWSPTTKPDRMLFATTLINPNLRKMVEFLISLS